MRFVMKIILILQVSFFSFRYSLALWGESKVACILPGNLFSSLLADDKIDFNTMEKGTVTYYKHTMVAFCHVIENKIFKKKQSSKLKETLLSELEKFSLCNKDKEHMKHLMELCCKLFDEYFNIFYDNQKNSAKALYHRLLLWLKKMMKPANNSELESKIDKALKNIRSFNAMIATANDLYMQKVTEEINKANNIQKLYKLGVPDDIVMSYCYLLAKVYHTDGANLDGYPRCNPEYINIFKQLRQYIVKEKFEINYHKSYEEVLKILEQAVAVSEAKKDLKIFTHEDAIKSHQKLSNNKDAAVTIFPDQAVEILRTSIYDDGDIPYNEWYKNSRDQDQQKTWLDYLPGFSWLRSKKDTLLF